jgi:hypothetical protein
VAPINDNQEEMMLAMREIEALNFGQEDDMDD